MITCSMPAATASSTAYWITGLSTSGSISFGCALVAGRNRVPQPAAGKTALRTRIEPLWGGLWWGRPVYPWPFRGPLQRPPVPRRRTRQGRVSRQARDASVRVCGILRRVPGGLGDHVRERAWPIEIREVERPRDDHGPAPPRTERPRSGARTEHRVHGAVDDR